MQQTKLQTKAHAERLYFTFQKDLMSLVMSSYRYFLASVTWFVLDFVSFSLWMTTCMNRNVELSSPGWTHFHFFFKIYVWIHIGLFPLEALLLLSHWNVNPWMKTYRTFRERMWWRLVSSLSQIELFIFKVTKVTCTTQISFICRLHAVLIFLHLKLKTNKQKR